jgi:plasmid stability protein
MAELHLADVPQEVCVRLQQQAAQHGTTAETEAVELLRRSLGSVSGLASQADLLAAMRRSRFTPPPGTPDSVELLREDRER